MALAFLPVPRCRSRFACPPFATSRVDTPQRRLAELVGRVVIGARQTSGEAFERLRGEVVTAVKRLDFDPSGSGERQQLCSANAEIVASLLRGQQ